MKTAINNTLVSMHAFDLIDIHNEYCSEVNDLDSCIYTMGSFDEVMSGMQPYDIARALFYGSFNPNDDYFCFNGYGNLVSFTYIGDGNCPIFTDDIADYIVRSGNDFGDDDIREILEGNSDEE